MTGPTVAVQSPTIDRNDSASLSDGSEEPWDQRRRDTGSGKGNKQQSKQQQQQDSSGKMRPLSADEEFLDDGDLPSLATGRTGGLHLGGRMVGGQRTATRPLKPGSTKGLATVTPKAERRKFWGQMDDGTGRDSVASDEEREQQRFRGNSSRKNQEEDGPDDEMAARRASRGNKQRKQKVPPQSVSSVEKDYDTDYSAPTIESQLTEVTEETTYDNTFCGQTLNVLDDMCGGNLNLTGGDESKGKKTRTLPSPEQPTQTSRSPRQSTSPPPRSEPPETAQQEHTAIEVEFVEPEPAKNSSEKEQAPSASSQRKNAYLTAMARKAKENFMSKKAKKAVRSEAAEAEDVLQPQAPPVISKSASEGDMETVENTDSFPAPKGSSSDPDDDYNNFSAAEKRKFIKLINSGVSAAEATQMVVNDRVAQKEKHEELRKLSAAAAEQEEQEEKEIARKIKGAGRLVFWKRGQQLPLPHSASSEENPPVVGTGSHDEEIVRSRSDESLETALKDGPVVAPEEESQRDVILLGPTTTGAERRADTDGETKSVATSVSDASSIPFEKSGNNYYDAVRRDQDYNDSPVRNEKRITPRGLDISKAQRLFAIGKPKGFAAMKDSPIKESMSTANAGLSEEDENVGDSELRNLSQGIFRTGTEMETVVAGTLAASESGNKEANLSFEGAEARLIRPTASVDVEDQTAPPDAEKDNDAVLPGAENDNTTSPIRQAAKLRGARLQEQKRSAIRSLSPPSRAPSETAKSVQESNRLRAKSASPHPPDLSLDVSMDTYFSSTTDAYTGHAGQSDNMSVYTVGTNVTGLSTYTKSSRVRRPGAAKSRLAKAEKEGAKKKQGWHETIRAVAESTNRVWDPKKGWVDYEEPDVEVIDTQPKHTEKIRLELDRSVLSHKTVSSSEDRNTSSGEAVPVPFPKEWEKDRETMIHVPGEGNSARSRAVEDGETQQPIYKDTSMELSSTGGGTRSLGGSTPARPKEWVESMRAASASLVKEGQIWDPEHGWTTIQREGREVSDVVDFGADAPEPNNVETFPKQTEKIHLSLDRSVIANKATESDGDRTKSGGLAVPVPFPQDWEKERNSMIQSPADANAPQSAAVENIMAPYPLDKNRAMDNENKGLSAATRSIGEPSLNSSASIGDTGSKGWIESMRAASASLAKEGQTWDPERGWTTIQKDDQAGSEVAPMDASHLSSMEKESNVDGVMDSSSSVVGKEPRLLVHPPPRDSSSKKLDQWVAKAGHASRNNHSEFSTGSSGRAVASGETSTPTDSDAGSGQDQQREFQKSQIKRVVVPSVERSAVSPFLSNEPANFSEDESEDDNDSTPLINPSGAFPSVDDRPISSLVDVVKEKVDSEDMGLFPQEDSKTPGSGGHPISGATPVPVVDQSMNSSDDRKTSVASATGTPRSTSVLSKDISVTSSRRGSGPVDTDEVDETWDSDDEQRHSKGWLAGAQGDDRSDQSFERSPNESHESEDEILHIKGWRDPASGLANMDASSGPKSAQVDGRDFEGNRVGGTGSSAGASTGSSSKKIPKLKRSKRDTSPLGVAAEPRGSSLGNEISTAQDTSPRDAQRPGRVGSAGKDRRSGSAGSQTDESDESLNVKARLREWETRIETSNSYDSQERDRKLQQSREQQGAVGTAGWKSFLGKKVKAETAAAAGQPKSGSGVEETKEPEGEYRKYTPKENVVDTSASPTSLGGGNRSDRADTEDDSLFQFADRKSGPSRSVDRSQASSALDFSDLSPIRAKEDQRSDYEVGSEAYGPAAGERRSFFQRVTECAAPMMPTSKNAPALCGRPDDIETESIAESNHSTNSAGEKHRRSISIGDAKPRSISAPRGTSRSDTIRVSSSSVVSEDFGAKTAYLDAVAMKAAVSRPRRSSSRRRDRSTAGSSVASGVTDHSEKWKALLERRRASGASPSESSRMSSSEVSRAAEKYASEKVEEIMTKMSSRSNSVARSRDVHREVDRIMDSGDEAETSDSGPVRAGKGKGQSVRAAEDLAAARVEAMMAALSTHPDEGEI